MARRSSSFLSTRSKLVVQTSSGNGCRGSLLRGVRRSSPKVPAAGEEQCATRTRHHVWHYDIDRYDQGIFWQAHLCEAAGIRLAARSPRRGRQPKPTSSLHQTILSERNHSREPIVSVPKGTTVDANARKGTAQKKTSRWMFAPRHVRFYSNGLRVLFMGTDDVSVKTLEQLHSARYATNWPRPAPRRVRFVVTGLSASFRCQRTEMALIR